jgi:S-adenosylmethionine:tRNA ribosyltransferase-isomerase
VSALAAATVPDLAEARQPAEALGLGREEVRLLVASPGRLRHARFAELPELLSAGDVLVVNTSRTIPASLRARRQTVAR